MHIHNPFICISYKMFLYVCLYIILAILALVYPMEKFVFAILMEVKKPLHSFKILYRSDAIGRVCYLPSSSQVLVPSCSVSSYPFWQLTAARCAEWSMRTNAQLRNVLQRARRVGNEALVSFLARFQVLVYFACALVINFRQPKEESLYWVL